MTTATDGLGVGTFVGVRVGMGVTVGEAVGVGVAVDVSVGVYVGVGDIVGAGVAVMTRMTVRGAGAGVRGGAARLLATQPPTTNPTSKLISMTVMRCLRDQACTTTITDGSSSRRLACAARQASS